jgi:exopolysaccharide production protein ExoQ
MRLGGMAFNLASLRAWALSGHSMLRLQAGLLGLLCFSVAMVPRLVPALLVVLALPAAIHVLVTDPKRLLIFLRTPVAIALAVFIAYLFINTSWAADRGAGFAKAATVLLLSTAAFFVSASFSLCSADEARVLAKSALAGLLFGAAILLVEIVFDAPLLRFLSNHVVPLITLTPKKVVVTNGKITSVARFVLNINVASLIMLFVPSLMFTAALASTKTKMVALGSLIAVTAACVFLSESGTSAVAFIVGGVVLVLGLLSLRGTRFLLAGAWVIATLFAVPLCALPYTLGWQHATWLSPDTSLGSSIGGRFYIWRFTADKVYERPITGIGIRSTRILQAQSWPSIGERYESGYQYRFGSLQNPLVLQLGRHAHNIFLQIWLELGAIGAVLLLGLGLTALWQTERFPPLLEAAAYGLFATYSLIGLSGFDIWQTWFLSSLAFAWAALLLASRLPLLSLHSWHLPLAQLLRPHAHSGAIELL